MIASGNNNRIMSPSIDNNTAEQFGYSSRPSPPQRPTSLSRSLGSNDDYYYGQDDDDDDDDDNDCRSVHSLPLLKDDDYYYYHGDGSKNSNAEEEKTSSNNSNSGGEEDDDEQVDHIKVLIRPPATMLQAPPPLKKVERDRQPQNDEQLRLSIRSVLSEVTCDWSVDDLQCHDESSSKQQQHHQDIQQQQQQRLENLSRREHRKEERQEEVRLSFQSVLSQPSQQQQRPPSRNHSLLDDDDAAVDDISIQDYITLKVRVAELESQLQLRRRNDSLQTLINSLQCENIELSSKLRITSQELHNERFEAKQVQALMRDKISNMKRELDSQVRKNEMLWGENRRLKKRQEALSQKRRQQKMNQHNNNDNAAGLSTSFKRRSTTGDLVRPYPEEEKESPTVTSTTVYVRSRRSSTCGSNPSQQRSKSSHSVRLRRPSLLEVLRCSFLKSSSASITSAPATLSDSLSQKNQHSANNKRMSEGSDTSRTTATTASTATGGGGRLTGSGTRRHHRRSSSELPPSSLPFINDDDSNNDTTTTDAETSAQQWSATCDEINHQTELFNRQSNARRLARMTKIKIHKEGEETGTTNNNGSIMLLDKKKEDDNDNHKDWTSSSSESNVNPRTRRPILSRRCSDFDVVQSIPPNDNDDNGHCHHRRPKYKRSRSFTLGESIRSMGSSMNSLCGMESGDEDDEEFDVNSVLWDSDDDGDEEGMTVVTRRSSAF